MQIVQSGVKMLKVILLQGFLVALAIAISTWFVGERGGYSALIGGLAYLLPNLLFVLRLGRADAAGQASVPMFFVGEFLKLVCTLAILFVAARFYPVQWLCLMGGLLAAVKTNLFALLLKI